MLSLFLMFSLSLSLVTQFSNVLGGQYIGVSSAGSIVWSEAEAYCESQYGTSLATITSVSENTAVRDAAISAGIATGSGIWIGLHDMNTEGTFEWQDGTGNADDYYTNWEGVGPGGTGNCVHFQSDDTWNDNNCDTVSYPFVCNYPQYVIVSETKKWSEAEEYCNNVYGTNLATITNADSSAALSALDSSSLLWIGLYDAEADNTYSNWIDGADVTYTNWASGEPNSNGEQCVLFNWSGTSIWNDYGCEGGYFFACNYDESTTPTNTPTSGEPTYVPSQHPTYVPSSVPSSVPSEFPTYHECSLLDDDIIISWDDVWSDSSVLSSGNDSNTDDETGIIVTQGINDDSGTFEVTVTVYSKYLVGATYSDYESYYQDLREDGYLGVTYVLDTNIFGNQGRLLQDSNSCENRLSSSYDGKSFVDSFWDYTLSPSNPQELGNDDYLEYGDQNIWDISLIDSNTNSECGTIEWQHTFSFYDLWYNCKDSNNAPSYELIENEDDNSIEIWLNFYLTLVSPNPLYLEVCDDGDTDCGRYLTKTLISHPLSVSFSKTQSIISNSDDVFIDLFTSNIIGAEFMQASVSGNESLKFTLTLITTVPAYMSLSVDTAVILSPTENDLVVNNNNLDFISNYYISEDTSSYMTDDCLILTDYRCFQQFDIVTQLSQCPSDTGLEFDGSYYFSADYNCIDEDTSVCDDYASDNPLEITLDTVNLQYTELCDETAYEIDWSGGITFYTDDTFDELTSSDNNVLTFTFGDTIYTRVSISDDIAAYQVFGMSITQCYVCTADGGTISSCLDSEVDTSLIYLMLTDSDLDYTLLDSNISDTVEDFSFTLPLLADNTFYVDCTVELEINNVISTNTRRILSTVTGNVFETVIGSGYATESDANNEEGNNSKSDDDFSVLYWILAGAGGLIILLLLLLIGLTVCKWMQNKNTTAASVAMELVASQPNTARSTRRSSVISTPVVTTM